MPAAAAMRSLASLAATLGLATLGGGLATIAGLPVAWLLGSTVAVAAAGLAGLDTRLPDPLRNLVFFILGIQAGAGVTPDVTAQLALWPLSFAIQMAGVVLIILATYGFLRGRLGWDRQTALFASLPGALSFVLAAAAETKADMTRVTVVQSVRLLLLIGALSPALAWLEAGDEIVAASRGANGGTAFDYGLFVGACLAASLLGHLSRLPGGMMLGALAASAALHVTEIAPVAIPSFVGDPGLVVLGALIGGRLKRENRAALRQLLPAAVAAFAIGLAISAIAALIAHGLIGLDFGTIALAYAPGALEALTVLAFQFDLDPAYVAAHHVVRFICIALLVPVLAGRLSRGGFGSGVDRRED